MINLGVPCPRHSPSPVYLLFTLTFTLSLVQGIPYISSFDTALSVPLGISVATLARARCVCARARAQAGENVPRRYLQNGRNVYDISDIPYDITVPPREGGRNGNGYCICGVLSHRENFPLPTATTWKGHLPLALHHYASPRSQYLVVTAAFRTLFSTVAGARAQSTFIFGIPSNAIQLNLSVQALPFLVECTPSSQYW